MFRIYRVVICSKLFVNLKCGKVNHRYSGRKKLTGKTDSKGTWSHYRTKKKENFSEVRKKLANVSVWSDEDLKVFEGSKTAF